MTIDEAKKLGINKLKQNVSIEDVNLKVKLFLSFVLGKTKEYILVHGEQQLNKQEEEMFFERNL